MLLRRKLATLHRQPRPLLCSNHLSEEHRLGTQLSTVLSVRIGTQCCQGLGLPSPLVEEPLVLRAQTKLPPTESASLDRMRAHHKRHGTKTWGRTEARDGAVQVFASHVARTNQKQWGVRSRQRRALLSARIMVCSLAAPAVPVDLSPRHQKPCCLTIAISATAGPLYGDEVPVLRVLRSILGWRTTAWRRNRSAWSMATDPTDIIRCGSTISCSTTEECSGTHRCRSGRGPPRKEDV